MVKRFLLISDIEATCDLSSPGSPPPEHEILEFPVLLCDLALPGFPVLDQVRFYVTPQRSRISAFCTQLTGITDETLRREGRSLQSAVDAIEALVGDERAADTVLCFDGAWDLELIQKEFREKSIVTRFPQLWLRFVDLKSEFRRAFPLEQFPDSACHPLPSLSAMKRYTKADKGLTAHQGLSDCLQIHAILEQMMRQVPGFQLSDGQVFDPKFKSKSFNDLFVEPLTVPQVLHALDFEPDQVLAIFCTPHMRELRTSSVHILPGSTIQPMSYVVVLRDSFQAQVFLMRGNVAAQCYNRSHWESLLAKNVPSLLLCVFDSEVLTGDPSQIARWRASLCYPLLAEGCKTACDALLHDAVRFEKKGQFDIGKQKRTAIAMEMTATASLAGINGTFDDAMQLNNLLAQLVVEKSIVSIAQLVERPLALGVAVEEDDASEGRGKRVTNYNAALRRNMMFFESVLVVKENSAIAAVVAPITSIDDVRMASSDSFLQEMLVGVPASLYFLDGKWRVLMGRRFRSFASATFNYSPDATVDAALFWKLFEEGKLSLPERNSLCYGFRVVGNGTRLVFEFAFDAQADFRCVTDFVPSASWPASRRVAVAIEDQPPTRVQGCWQVSNDGKRLLELHSEVFKAYRSVMAQGAYHFDAVEHMMTLLLFVTDSSWFNVSQLNELFQRCKVWFDAKLRDTDEEYTSKRYLPNAKWHEAIAESPVRNWLVEMRKEAAKDTRSFLVQRVPPKVLAILWKKDVRAAGLVAR